MQKAKKNMRKINFKKAVVQKFKEYNQTLEALINFNVSVAFEKAIQARFLTEIRKLLPTHILKAIVNYARPRLNTSELDVIKNNQINLFTQSSTSVDDLLEMDVKIKLLNRIHLNKSNTTHTTNQSLYDTLYESIILNQEALDAQEVEPSFHKWTLDIQDPSNNHEGGTGRKEERMLVNLLLDHQGKKNLSWFMHKMTLRPCKPKTKKMKMMRIIPIQNEIDQNESHILRPSTVAIAKKLKALIQKDELTLADLKVLSEAKWNSDDDDEDSKIDFFKAEMSTKTEGDVYLDLRIKSAIRIVVKKKWGYGFLTSILVRRSDDQEFEFSF
ncbi:hypothetical protein Tco_0051705 [Tanacetum coccineum]